MKLFIEGYEYTSIEARQILLEFNHKRLKNGISTDCVGYCYSKSLEDCIFFLPKVVCDTNDKVLGICSPDECVDFEKCALSEHDRRFIQGLNIWIYRALKRFSGDGSSSGILLNKCFPIVNRIGHKVGASLLDRVLALIEFYKENHDYIIYTIKNAHSQRHRINWQKTVANSTAVIQDDTPFYLAPISKKKCVDWEESLMIIFFSILNYVQKYGFSINLDTNYEIIKGSAFKRYLDGLGVKKLRQIKHRYFSDKTQKLWSLCYSFFATTESINSSKEDYEYLIATSFHVAFESMVDELIGDPSLAHKKILDDGKIIDHIYLDTSLLSKDLVYYIGDSKYYKTSSSVKERSVSAYKQYTYARNIVHESIKNSFQDTWPFRDQLTEGYCITPNFFISAEIDQSREYNKDGFSNKDVMGKHFASRAFKNRLFDRDTLWVNQYNLNFLYLLSTYASNEKSLKDGFRKKAHQFFRDQTIKLMNKTYAFWVLKPHNGKTLKETLNDTLKWKLRGTIYKLTDESLLFALEKPLEGENEQDNILFKYEREKDLVSFKSIIDENFIYERCILSNKDNCVIEYTPEKDSSWF